MYRIILIYLFFITFLSNAQQDPVVGMFWNTYSHFNPAISGMEWKHKGSVLYRNQWEKVKRAPNTLFANYNTIMFEKHGVGVNYLYDEAGFSTVHKANINYNYQLKINESDKLAFGVAVGVHQYDFSAIWIYPYSFYDYLFPAEIHETSLNLNIGFSYLSKRVFAGLSVTQVSPSFSERMYNPAPHLHAHFRYELLSTEKISLFLEAKDVTDFIKNSFDISARVRWNNKLVVGLGYRNSDMIGGNISWDFKEKFRMGYSYEYSINKLSSISEGTHEVVLGIRLN